MSDLIFQDAFNLLCGKELGKGIHRHVFLCKIDPSLVVKVEYEEDFYTGSNGLEWQNWQDMEYAPTYKKWLAPCTFISPNGKILLQKRTTLVPSNRLPDKLPAWLMDVKWENFGMYQGRIVCHDYPRINGSLSKRMVKANLE